MPVESGDGPVTSGFGPDLRGGLMVCGTTSDAGKTQVVTGLCRLLARNGIRVAPFKAQNMANNSYVTDSGHEIGRAQAVQAMAAGIRPEVAMNPVLLKPTGERTSQVVIMGRPAGHLTAAEYHEYKPQLLDRVLEALADLRRRFDVVLVEGAGSPAEINLLDHDIVNLRIAHEADLHALVVGDIDRGGVFAALHGTVDLLPPHYRRLVGGFVINKLRGDPDLLLDGTDQLSARCGVPTIGVLPWIPDIALDAEDSLALDGHRPRPAGDTAEGSDEIDVAVVRFPRLSNFTDLDALSIEPGVSVRYIASAAALGQPDLLVLPGTKTTVADLAWLRACGLARAVTVAAAEPAGPIVIGICGGYQMLGRVLHDPHGVEAACPDVSADGLGLLDVVTTFDPVKITRQRRGNALGQPLTGYQIHHGRVARGPTAEHWISLDPIIEPPGAAAEGARPAEGAVAEGSRVMGTTLHGLFEADGFRAAFLVEVAQRRGKAFVPAGVGFEAARGAQFDRIADALETHVDLAHLARLIATAPPPKEPA